MAAGEIFGDQIDVIVEPVIAPVLPLAVTPITGASRAVNLDFAKLDLEGDAVSSDDSDLSLIHI